VFRMNAGARLSGPRRLAFLCHERVRAGHDRPISGVKPGGFLLLSAAHYQSSCAAARWTRPMVLGNTPSRAHFRPAFWQLFQLHIGIRTGDH